MRLSAVVVGFALLLAPLWTPGAFAQQAREPLAEAAGAYALYQDDISWLARAPIDNPAALDEALERTARHQPEPLARGWVAYAALSAAQSPAFVAGVRARVRAANRAAVLRRLNADLGYARHRPQGSAEAVRLVLQSADADGARVGGVADRFLALGDSLRSVAWANAILTDRDTRSAHLRTLTDRSPPGDLALRLRLAPLAAAPLSDPNAFGGRFYWDALAGAPVPLPYPRAPSVTERRNRAAAIDRVLTLAALRILDATAASSSRVNALLGDANETACLTMALLEFRQCVSVTQFGYENAFCLARHGLREPSACIASVAPSEN